MIVEVGGSSVGPTGFGDGRLTRFADSIWTAAMPIRFAGTWFPHVMSAVRLTSEDVLLHSPCRASQSLAQEIATIGRVTDVVAPNWFHDLYLAEYHALYPDATFWGPTFLQRQRKSIVSRVLDGTDRAPWFPEMQYVSVPGILSFDECLFFHVATRTLIAADLLMNTCARADAPALTKLGYRFFGLDGRLKVFPILRWFGIANRAPLRRAARQIFQWKPERLIVGHGRPIDKGVIEQLSAAFRWLVIS